VIHDLIGSNAINRFDLGDWFGEPDGRFSDGVLVVELTDVVDGSFSVEIRDFTVSYRFMFIFSCVFG